MCRTLSSLSQWNVFTSALEKLTFFVLLHAPPSQSIREFSKSYRYVQKRLNLNVFPECVVKPPISVSILFICKLLPHKTNTLIVERFDKNFFHTVIIRSFPPIIIIFPNKRFGKYLRLQFLFIVYAQVVLQMFFFLLDISGIY